MTQCVHFQLSLLLFREKETTLFLTFRTGAFSFSANPGKIIVPGAALEPVLLCLLLLPQLERGVGFLGVRHAVSVGLDN